MKGRRRKLVLNYDRDHDVLYVSLGAPKPSYADEDIDGILVRRTFDGDRLSGGDYNGLLDEEQERATGADSFQTER